MNVQEKGYKIEKILSRSEICQRTWGGNPSAFYLKMMLDRHQQKDITKYNYIKTISYKNI
ncbi:hypothetical protein C6C12_04700 [Clostridium botulinum]|nr:hypothetical protein C6C12_04700 [Clostridium botulinum]